MSLMFKAGAICDRDRGLTFDDVLLVPRHSQISSRRDPSLGSFLTKNYQLDIPLISANMDTITEKEMACSLSQIGGVGIIHRFMDVSEQVSQIKEVIRFQEENNIKRAVCASIGVKEEGMQRCDHLIDAGVNIITLDIAHGDSIMMLEVLEYVKKKYPAIDVIAGNVATAEATRRLIDAGADAVKVGIGPGSMCTTRIITGHGVPQLTAIALCVAEARKSGIPIVADGGIKTSGDMVKALCAGADSIMVGSLLSGTLETPGEVKSGMKAYRGMASKSAQVSWRGELPEGMAAEGESTLVPCKGPVSTLVHELMGGVRSGMTYLGAMNIREMEENALFMEMSASGMAESKPHGVK